MIFNGTQWPRIRVAAGIGTAPGGTVCVLGSGVLDTNVLGGPNMVEIAATGNGDVRSVSIQDYGFPSEIDAASPATCTILLGNASGDYDPTNAGSPYAGMVEIGAPIQVYAERPVGMLWPLFTGEIADIATDAGRDPTVVFTCTDGLEFLGRAYLPLEVAPVFAGDLTGTRISNLADRAAWPIDKRNFDAGSNVLGGTLLGSSALDLMQQVERTEFGNLFVDQAGVLTFYDRYRTTTANRSVIVQAAFTDVAGGIGYSSLELARSRERVYNRAAVTRNPRVEDPDEQPIEQVADDLTSQTALKAVLAFPAQVGDLLQSDTEALAMAQGLVGRFATPQHRIREIRVNLLRGDGWSTLLGLQLLDRISVLRDYGPNTISQELLIQQMSTEIRVSPATWELRLVTSPAPTAATDVCVLDSGLLGTHKLGW
jgi:hypothetical protein